MTETLCAREGCGHAFTKHEGNCRAQASEQKPDHILVTQCACEEFVWPAARVVQP